MGWAGGFAIVAGAVSGGGFEGDAGVAIRGRRRAGINPADRLATRRRPNGRPNGDQINFGFRRPRRVERHARASVLRAD